MVRVAMTTMRRSTDPLWWLLFAAGGVVAALLMPITILITGIAIPFGWISESDLLSWIRHPLGRVYLLLLISLPLFHWAHRFRYALVDMGLGRVGRIKVLFYGTAVAGSVLAGWLLLRL
jgi:fumarate reductase subunit D